MNELLMYHNKEVETALLAKWLISSDSAYVMMGTITEKHIYTPELFRIYKAIEKLVSKNEEISLVTVGSLPGIDPIIVTEIAEKYTHISDSFLFSELEKYRRVRAFAEVCFKASADIQAGEVENSIDAAINELLSIDQTVNNFEYLMRNIMESAVNRWSKNIGRRIIKFGIPELDKRINARMGNLLYVIAPPKTGKTWFLIMLAVQLSHAGFNVGFVSAEMHHEDLGNRIASYVSGVDISRFDDPDTPKTDYQKFSDNLYEINNLKINIIPALGITFLKLQSLLRKIRSKYDIIIIDYLQKIMNPSAKDLRVATVLTSDMLASYCKKNEKFLIVASQAGRQAHNDKDTKTYHGKESSSIEADADILLALTDKTDYSAWKLNEPKKLKIELAQRNGCSGNFEIPFDPRTGRISDGAF